MCLDERPDKNEKMHTLNEEYYCYGEKVAGNGPSSSLLVKENIPTVPPKMKFDSESKVTVQATGALMLDNYRIKVQSDNKGNPVPENIKNWQPPPSPVIVPNSNTSQPMSVQQTDQKRKNSIRSASDKTVTRNPSSKNDGMKSINITTHVLLIELLC